MHVKDSKNYVHTCTTINSLLASGLHRISRWLPCPPNELPKEFQSVCLHAQISAQT